ncbi:hypothetical protein RUM43_010913 [Polyplax serrata]|uniref:WH2 domain-containing protein n=1 Tax=Polyplax serrata TaxID=468196 RepID=A0AAN8NSN5_POLSC
MPVGPGGGNTSGTQPRQTFRPPWVKNDPPPVPMPTQPWVKASRNVPSSAENKQENQSPFGKITLRKVTEPPTSKSMTPTAAPTAELKPTKVTTFPPKENGTAATSGREVKKAPPTSQNTQKPVAQQPAKNNVESANKPPIAESTKNVEVAQKPPVPMYRRTSEITIPIETSKATKPSETPAKIPEPPKPPIFAGPPAPPAPPPPPPMEGQPPVKTTLTPEKKQKLEMLRSRPKKRPDWGNMMKEIETGRKLNHVQCNDRSSPLLPKVKAKGQFVYESERPNLHNQLLKQIESGIRLKPTKTNDKSKPFIEGLRKFRRQMTIEEQIQKSASMASMGIVEAEPDPLDEVDDIDKVRDDLQSTKQMLAMELKNKEALERENKKLVTKILNLEVEVEKEKNKTNKEAPTGNSELRKEIEALKQEAKKAKELAEEMETKYHDIQGQYDLLKLDLDESVQKSQRLEKQLRVAQAANLANQTGQPLTKQPSKKIVYQNTIRETPVAPESEEEEEEEETETETETESDSEDNGENEEAQKERRLLRELKLLTTKLQSFKSKKEVAKKERKTLKDQMNKLQKGIKEEKKNYKVLQKEVDKMSKLMNEGDDDEEEEEEDEDEDVEEEESSEDEEETEESESEESEGSLPESAPPEKRKVNLQDRAKKYENLLSSLKKGNYLLKANVDRYKDELNKQKEMALTLQEDLNSVLSELG